jgi:hypothetical protein
MNFIQKIQDFRLTLRADSKKRNRFYLLVFTIMLVSDYLLYCYHVEQNPLVIFPPFPILDQRDEVEIVIPDIDGKSLLNETRLMQRSETTEGFITQLVYEVAAGSKFENTRLTVPIQCIVRTVWILDSVCYIDLRMEYLEDDVPIIPGSEENFRNAISQTVSKNIDGIESVTIIENGIYNRSLWEISRLDETSITQ